MEEQKGLQLMPERVDGQCRDDIVRQCIPDLGGNWLPIVDSLECVMTAKWFIAADWSVHRPDTSATGLSRVVLSAVAQCHGVCRRLTQTTFLRTQLCSVLLLISSFNSSTSLLSAVRILTSL